MKTPIIICALTMSIVLMKGQSEEKTSVIRIKKIETINGVERTLDTTYRVSGPIYLKETGNLNIEEKELKTEGKTKKMVIITDEVSGDDSNMKTVDIHAEMDEQMQRALKAADVDGKNLDIDRVIVLNNDEKTADGKCDKKITRIIITKKINISELSDSDIKMLGKESGIKDNKLGLDKMNFYPNPSNGKFNLCFTLPEKKETEVNIINAEGKNIYHENISNFSGKYDKEMDISANPKGIYFVKISQGKNAQTKKIVIE